MGVVRRGICMKGVDCARSEEDKLLGDDCERRQDQQDP